MQDLSIFVLMKEKLRSPARDRCMLHQKLLKVADYIMANTMARSVLIQGMMNIKYSNIWEFKKESSNFRE